MTVSDGDVVNGSTIYTYVPTAIFFWNQNDRDRTRAKALTYIPAVQMVLDLALNLLSLLGICPICSTVGQARSRNQINLIPAGVKGSKVIFFPLCMKVYLLLLPWCLVSISYSQGLPNKREHASIGSGGTRIESNPGPSFKYRRPQTHSSKNT